MLVQRMIGGEEKEKIGGGDSNDRAQFASFNLVITN